MPDDFDHDEHRDAVDPDQQQEIESLADPDQPQETPQEIESPMLVESEPRDMDLGPDKRGVWIWGVVAALIVVGAAVGGIFYYRSITAPVSVPGVTGRVSAQATQALNDAGLRLGELTTVATATAPVGTVIDQDPEQGASVDRGTSVSLVVAAKPDVSTVPDVTGRPVKDARSTLAAERLYAFVVESYSATHTADTVISQLPSATITLPPGSGVALIVSRGPKPTTTRVPSLQGLGAVEAADVLQSLGLQPLASRSVTASFSAGEIAGQDPKPGTSAQIGSTVQFLVSDGKAIVPVTVPAIVGKSQPDAESAIKKAGLQVLTRSVPDARTAAGKVVSQMPSGGAKTARGATVTLVVSRGDAAGFPVPGLAGKASLEASGAIAAAGFKPVLFGVPSKLSAGLVFGQFPAEGSMWPSLFPVVAIFATPEG